MNNSTIINLYNSAPNETAIPFKYEGRNLILSISTGGAKFIKSAFGNDLMVIDKITDTHLHLNSYNLMGIKTTFDMIIENMEF